MQITYSWIDSPLLIDLLGGDLWNLLKTTAEDESILGIGRDTDESAGASYLKSLKHTLEHDGHLLIGTVKGKIVLTCLLRQQSFQTMRHMADLQKGTIDRAYRGKGLLKDALRHIVERSEQIGVQRLTLDVREGSAAHRLWSHWGFETFGVLRDYSRYEGYSYPGHFMHQSVSDLDKRLRIGRKNIPQYSV